MKKIRTEDADTLGAKIEFLKKRLTELCTQTYIIKGARNGEKILCDKIDNIPGKWGVRSIRKENLENN